MQVSSILACILALSAIQVAVSNNCPTLYAFETGVVHGFVSTDFIKVAEQFHLNCNGTQPPASALDEGVPVGGNPTENGQVFIYEGECVVVNLWCGILHFADNSPITEHSLFLPFSVAKNPVADALIMMNSRGYFDWNTPVAHYWPEFGQSGKSQITVGELFSDAACLIFIGPITFADDTLESNFSKIKHLLEIQAPDPNCRIGIDYGYSPVVWGFYAEVFSTYVDPLHRYITDFVYDELAIPLGVKNDFFFGIRANDTVTPTRIADLRPGVFPTISRASTIEANEEAANTSSPQYKSIYNPPSVNFFALPEDARAPSSVFYVSAGAAAKIQAVFTNYGTFQGHTYASKHSVEVGTATKFNGSDFYGIDPIALSQAGFNKIEPRTHFAPNNKAFGKYGSGSSLVFSDPVNRLTFAYVTALFSEGSDNNTQPYNVYSLYNAMYASQNAQSSVDYCNTINIPSTQGYFCDSNDKGFYQCLGGAYSGQSAHTKCPAGTKCRCDTQTECSSQGSPCVTA